MSRYKIVGTDGSRWTAGLGELVDISGDGVEGLLGDPEWEDQTQESALLPGQLFIGTRALPRRVQLPMKIGFDKPSEQFRSIDRQWWKAWQPGQYATIEVATEGSKSRYLDVRFVGDGGWTVGVDPDVFSRTQVPMSLVADDPFWRGPEESFAFIRNDAPVDFYGRDRGQSGGPDFYLSKSFRANEQMLYNPGDVPAPILFTLSGPFEQFALTVNGFTVRGEFDVPEGSTVTVDSGSHRVLLDDGSPTPLNITKRVSWGFSDLPPGETVPVEVELHGTGLVSAAWTPKFRRAA